ncbi:MAG: TlpA family protein disulfide reductase [Verrucomicrobiales bacterium]|nr:TlpA family protein disulfide reductase [Verrucomicrobiales bacterium]
MSTLGKIFATTVVLLSIFPACLHAETKTPSDQFSELSREYGTVTVGIRAAQTDLERTEVVEKMGAYPSRFLDLAETYLGDPVALDALRQAVQAASSSDSVAQIAWETNQSGFPEGCNDGSASRTIRLLMRGFVLSDRIDSVCDRLRYSYRLESGEFLRAVMAQNPHRNMRGLACVSLAQFLQDKLRALRLVDERPEMTECYRIVFGEDYLPALRLLGAGSLVSEIESLFEQAEKEYGDVEARAGKVGDIAKTALYELRHLGIGKTVPETQGRDQDGAAFKLADYRGKVVMLYFWSEYCLTCQTMWAHDRSLMNRLGEKPFALIGVNHLYGNTHERPAGELSALMKAGGVTWRTFDDGDGGISRLWNYPATPTVYLIDTHGVIRHKWAGKPGEKTLDVALEVLLTEAEDADADR